ncbi:tyrosinase family oxidase copper chaperone [Actinacidiphila rubida]|uniref:Tyrosinase co-factor MelC1 n=1 Tax=Actinacidiphila rubida TaxID=310780 RepID=A0A1H8TQP0_9ACTN|nr:tyrosinase family oxidase copper chaperone [Actinacidiphila rubida]SEO92748.1 Tyrosinase co-factor MelC1 [Actinacidiphila rubida]
MVTRRRMLRTGLTTVAAVSGTGAALRPMLAAGQSGGHDGAGAAVAAQGAAAPARPAGTPLFDEVYRGRRIQGFTTADDDRIGILVDGRPLHVMRRVDGSWISMANHYQPFATPLATARGAVDVMGHAVLAAAPVQLPILRH